MRIGIMGAGAYALALSSILYDNKNNITLWTEFLDEKDLLVKTRENHTKLPGFKLGEGVSVTTSIKEALKDKDLIILAVPVQFLASVCEKMKPFIEKHSILIASKGIDTSNLLFTEEIISSNLGTKDIAVLSGPTFAKDILDKGKMGLSVAYKTDKVKECVTSSFINSYISLDFTKDIIGVELCGALKNIYAIMMGVLEGLNCNESTKAMFMTKVVKEMSSILEDFGGGKETILSYAGVGDTLLTCTSKSSRNYSFGVLLGSGVSRSEVKNYLDKNTVEGFYTLKAIIKMLTEKSLHYPLIETLEKVVNYEVVASKILDS